MKRVVDFLFSPKLMAVILALFAISIAVATFIENDFGSASARALVYNARWFEILLLLGVINLSGTIVLKNYTEEIHRFLFHLSFILILIGQPLLVIPVLRHSVVREGESSQVVLSDKTYIEIKAGEEENNWQQAIPHSSSERGETSRLRYRDKTTG
jgi:hypothetical protein